MLGNWAFQTFFIGPKLDAQKLALTPGVQASKTAELTAQGGDMSTLTEVVSKQVELLAGKEVLASINILPLILIVAFAGLWFFMRKK